MHQTGFPGHPASQTGVESLLLSPHPASERQTVGIRLKSNVGSVTPSACAIVLSPGSSLLGIGMPALPPAPVSGDGVSGRRTCLIFPKPHACALYAYLSPFGHDRAMHRLMRIPAVHVASPVLRHDHAQLVLR